MKPFFGRKNHLEEALNEARQLAQELALQAQERMRDAQERARESQERTTELARERAKEAHELARRAADAMPPGLPMRLLSSIVGIPLLILLVFWEGPAQDPALPFTFAVAICAVTGAVEYFRGLRLRGFQPNEPLAVVAIVLLQFAAWNDAHNRISEFLPALIAVLVIGTLIYEVASHEKEPLANIGVTFLGVVYVGWLFSYLVFLRSLPGSVSGYLPDFVAHLLSYLHLPPLPAARGAWTVLYVFAVTWGTDAGAYFLGMRFGRHKLAPRLSPKKTVEGAFGGVIAATAASFAWGLGIGMPWWHCLILGPMLGILGQIGDLCESALKRDIGVKDFGMVLPGHGGILDRFDSLLFTAPVAYYYLQFIVGHSFR